MWKDDELKKIADAVAVSFSAAQALRLLGLRVAGGNYATLYRLIARFRRGQGHLRGQRHGWATRTPLEEVLVSESPYFGGTSKLKQRLIDSGLLNYACAVCNIAEWRSSILNLHLDHINGVRNDNRLENLRLLCPNCHSQTATYCGRNKALRRGRMPLQP